MLRCSFYYGVLVAELKGISRPADVIVVFKYTMARIEDLDYQRLTFSTSKRDEYTCKMAFSNSTLYLLPQHLRRMFRSCSAEMVKFNTRELG